MEKLEIPTTNAFLVYNSNNPPKGGPAHDGTNIVCRLAHLLHNQQRSLKDAKSKDFYPMDEVLSKSLIVGNFSICIFSRFFVFSKRAATQCAVPIAVPRAA